MKNFDLSLYLVTDRTLTTHHPIEYIIEQAVLGGVTMVQLREKHSSIQSFIELAIRIKKLLIPYHVPLIINDSLEVAIASDADGLHIGQKDASYSEARKALGDDKIIGLSVETIQQAKDANQLDVDYISVSPVFTTATKRDISTPLGLEGLSEIVSFSNHPVIAIGGINIGNSATVIKAGAKGIAVVSAIITSKDPQQAAKELKNVINL